MKSQCDDEMVKTVAALSREDPANLGTESRGPQALVVRLGYQMTQEE